MLIAEVIGNLGADAEVKNDEYISFRVAHNEKTRTLSSVIENTTWVSVSMSLDRKGILPYLKKGTCVYVRGNLRCRVYVGNDGHHHAGVNIRALHVELCGGPRQQQAESSNSANSDNSNIPF